MNTKNAKQLGFLNESIIQLQIKFNLIIFKLASLVEATFVCLEIPIVQKSQSIKYIDSKPHYFEQNLKIRFSSN